MNFSPEIPLSSGAPFRAGGWIPVLGLLAMLAVGQPRAVAQYQVTGRIQAGAGSPSAAAGYSVSGTLTPALVPGALAGGGYALTGRLAPGVALASGDFDPQPEPPGIPPAIHLWSGDGVATDGTGRANGVLEGNATFGEGWAGLGFLLPGGDAFQRGSVSFGTTAGNFGTGDFTVSMQVRLPLLRASVSPRLMHLLAKRGGCSHGSFWNFGVGASGVPFFEFDENSAGKNYGSVSGSGSIRDGRWHQVAVVRRGTRIQFFQDGRLVGAKETEGVIPFANGAALTLGVGPCTDAGQRGLNVWPFEGAVDDLRILDTALDPAQVAAVGGFGWRPAVVRQPAGGTYNAPASEHRLEVAVFSLAHDLAPYRYQWRRNGVPIPGAPAARWVVHPVDADAAGIYTVEVSNRFGTTTSGAAVIVVRSGNPLAPGPDHWWSGDGDALDRVGSVHGTLAGNARHGPGRVGQAFEFPGGDWPASGSVGFGAEVGNFGTGDFTVEYWLRTTHPKLMEVAGKRLGCNHGNWWETFVSADGRPFAQVDEDPAGRNYLGLAPPPGVSFADGAWHHVVFVREGTQLRFHLDGKRVGENRTDGVVALDNDAPFRLGVGPCTDGGHSGFNVWPFAGSLDEVKIYHSALSDRQIAAAADRRTVPAVLAPETRAQAGVLVENGARRFQWRIEPGAGRGFTAEDAEEVLLESSTDLRLWSVVPGAVRLVGSVVEVVDPRVFEKRESFYRIAFRDPAARRTVGGAVASGAVPREVLDLASAHIEAFLGEPAARTAEEAEWGNVEIGPGARQVFDPAHRNATEPAYLELPVVERGSGAERGYVLVSIADGAPRVVEFATAGKPKTTRAMREVEGVNPGRFVRFSPGFLAMEDGEGRLLGTLGTWPALPAGSPPAEAREVSGDYDSETGVRPSPRLLALERAGSGGYAELKSAFASNPTRSALRALRQAGEVSRAEALGTARRRLTLGVGTTQDFQTDRAFAAVRVDADLEDGRAPEDEPVSVQATLLRPGGFRLTGLQPGSDLVRVRTGDGQVETYVVVVSAGRGPSLAAFNPACYQIDTRQWVAGTGWHGDQRQYEQPKLDLWCPAVGCGPVALAMFFGWWDVHGVPSAFYHLDRGFGDAHDFRFRLSGIRSNSAAKTMTPGELIQPPGAPHELYALSSEERVVHDFHGLCNTFCADGQGATTPDQLVAGAVEYLDRVSGNLFPPQDEFGEKFLSAVLSYSYTDGYWAGMTDWQGGGVKVANGIKKGRPGIVGLGDTLFDLHYALAYAYKRIDTYHLCDGPKELLGRTRWFKCNMGWGSDDAPEWHDAESVWFGMTGVLAQKHVP